MRKNKDFSINVNEVDVLNVAIFGMTAKQWQETNSDLKGNIANLNAIHKMCLQRMFLDSSDKKGRDDRHGSLPKDISGKSELSIF